MSPEEKLEMGRKLIAEAEAEIAAKKRNWPEKIEAGMVFSEPNGSSNAWFAAGVGFTCISGSCLGMWRETLPSGCHYIGNDCISIRIRKDADDAHEPTGAELVGKMCMFRGFNLGQDNPEEWFGPWMCRTFDPDDQKSAYRTGEVGKLTGWYKEARLAKGEA